MASRPRPAPWLWAALWLWVAAGAVVNASWRNPDPPLVPRYEAVAPLLPEGSLGFVTGRERRAAGYSWSAFRYGIAPRKAVWEGPRPASEWLVADRAPVPRGYRLERRLDEDLALLRRE